MEIEIEMLRKKLNDLVEKSVSLHSDEVVKLSQELDELIYTYYEDIRQKRLAV